MVPLRLVTRNRWWTLAWAAGICWTAVEVSGHGATDPADANAAAANASVDQAESEQANAVMAVLK